MTDNTHRHVERYERFAMRRYPMGGALADLLSWHRGVCIACGAVGVNGPRTRRTIHSLLTGKAMPLTEAAWGLATEALCQRIDARERRRRVRATLATQPAVTLVTTAEVIAEAAR